MDFHGLPWTSMNFHELPWTSLEWLGTASTWTVFIPLNNATMNDHLWPKPLLTLYLLKLLNRDFVRCLFCNLSQTRNLLDWLSLGAIARGRRRNHIFAFFYRYIIVAKSCNFLKLITFRKHRRVKIVFSPLWLSPLLLLETQRMDFISWKSDIRITVKKMTWELKS